jgi:hypothetical protein
MSEEHWICLIKYKSEYDKWVIAEHVDNEYFIIGGKIPYHESDLRCIIPVGPKDEVIHMLEVYANKKVGKDDNMKELYFCNKCYIQLVCGVCLQCGMPKLVTKFVLFEDGKKIMDVIANPFIRESMDFGKEP